MYVSSRERNIIRLLIKEEEALTVQQIADHLRVSPRTVHRDLKGLDQVLARFGLKLNRQAGIGVSIEGEMADKQALWSAVSRLSFSEYTPEERKAYLLSSLLESSEPLKLTSLARELKVTPATVSQDLSLLEGWLDSFDLRMIRRRGWGVMIQGAEDARRKAMRALIADSFPEEELLHLLKEPAQTPSLGRVERISQRLLGLLEKEHLAVVEEIVRREVSALPYALADSAYIGLVVHIALAVERIGRGETLARTSPETGKDTREFEVAARMAKELEDGLHLDIPEAEVGSIAMYLRGAKLRDEKRDWPEEADVEIAMKAAELIRFVEAETGVKLTDHFSLKQGLIVHLERAVYRLNQNLRIHNPLLEEIRRGYPRLFGVIREGVEQVLPHLSVPPEEIGYLVMHFGSFLERRETAGSIRALVVCSSGVGSSKLLSSRIRKEIPEIKQLTRASLLELKELDTDRYHLLISTVPLPPEYEGYIRVHPFPTKKDIQNIKDQLPRCQEQAGDAKALLPEDGVSTLKNVHEWTGHALALLKGFRHEKVEDPGETPEALLYPILTRLEKAGVITEAGQVLTRLMEREKLGGMGIPGTRLALFHTRGGGVERSSFTVHSLSRPVCIRGMDQSEMEVTTLLLLLAPDKISRAGLDLLSWISSFIVESRYHIRIFESGSPLRVREFLTEHLLRYLQEMTTDKER
ncbi:BglG family transcription antiterminator [Paludifilum halophilum]|uniref:Uncharacterized protein n=1 Tax=Paludifilum halophilum TaxID=1642702 RepID=A0A235BE38_9BACL|nr:PRD domain-containing protein [Paludifilum halophilum]OYD09865.1 hypothetical protein CHM34_02450 [Paludifilum halophilum]